ncbi:MULTISPECIES: ABC transporter ATP-binding protein [unclassified Bradyrhizobium]|uniref:ABC transporter ATP-binding protein n=1 Tax=unclassified Bradyrhizobium TaxID=2631580 RepID=UPI001FF959CE|nr:MULTISPECIES: ABC transporter ATP-binding protein [unclassified Bradyrhizobium]MCK1423005.1 ABC transporter ATP-binding protein [Bradyrhizobium sp. CW12]MCK1643772.1 ABC transporter ATP-binding protein [Bradyrhizobium sp. 154]
MTAPALEVTGLHRFFGGLPAVRDVSMLVPVGERRLLLGPNGAGKTTLFNLIAGDFPASRGEIRIFGENVTGKTADQRTHLGMARTYQIITLFPKNTLVHNVVISLLGLLKLRFSPLADIRKHKALWDEARTILALVGLEHLAERTVADTSYGEKRRLEIAMALAQKPKLLLLDEPLAGLSADERRDVERLLQTIPRDVTIIMIEHDMDVALAFADVITVMQHGQIVVEGNRAEVVADPKTREVYLGH